MFRIVERHQNNYFGYFSIKALPKNLKIFFFLFCASSGIYGYSCNLVIAVSFSLAGPLILSSDIGSPIILRFDKARTFLAVT